MHFNEFIQFIIARKCQFTKRNVLKIFDEFFSDGGNVRNNKKWRIVHGFLQVAVLIIDPGVQSPPNNEKDQIQWVTIIRKNLNDKVKILFVEFRMG